MTMIICPFAPRQRQSKVSPDQSQDFAGKQSASQTIKDSINPVNYFCFLWADLSKAIELLACLDAMAEQAEMFW